jgi:hypothetical protein
MSGVREEKANFYDGRYGRLPDHLQLRARPQLILQCYLDRQVNKKISLEEARKQLSKKTGISETDLIQLEGGAFPTSFQIRQLKEGLWWSVLFLFGISESAYLNAEQIFFNDLEIETPSPSDRSAFQSFYEEFLEVLGSESKGGKK